MSAGSWLGFIIVEALWVTVVIRIAQAIMKRRK